MALLLSVVGLYGIIAYSVSQRTREIGVRMALGTTKSVYQLILKEAGWLAAGGIILGIVCSMMAATLMGKLLFGVHSWEWPLCLLSRLCSACAHWWRVIFLRDERRRSIQWLHCGTS